MNNNNIYRYKITSQLNELVIDFARIHKLDDRPIFKEYWEKFVELNSEIIKKEQKIVDDMKLDRDILAMIYKSARYYYKNKSNNSNIKQNNNEKEKRRYIKISNELNDILNEYVLKHIQAKTKPSNGLDIFLIEQYEIINREINKFKNNNKLSPEDISNKIKKMYKNKYFTLNKKVD
jgi:hypothetical protein